MQNEISENALFIKEDLKLLEAGLQEKLPDSDICEMCETILLDVSSLYTKGASEAERFLLLAIAYAVVPTYNGVVLSSQIPLHLESVIKLTENINEW